MCPVSLTGRKTIFNALVEKASIHPAFQGDISVIDPKTGELVAITELDFRTLSKEDRALIGDQLF